LLLAISQFASLAACTAHQLAAPAATAVLGGDQSVVAAAPAAATQCFVPAAQRAPIGGHLRTLGAGLPAVDAEGEALNGFDCTRRPSRISALLKENERTGEAVDPPVLSFFC
jgi:hypothetical protein